MEEEKKYMKALQCREYGPPETLFVAKSEKPHPKDTEILIRIRESVITPADCAIGQGKPFIVRLFSGFFRPRFPILGVELAGEVEAIGKDVQKFKPGDQVFASSKNCGAHAEYICLSENALVALKPSTMDYGEAAALCDGGLTSLTFLRDKAHIQKGQKILINGASGSVGTFAVQLAKYFGATVCGVCSSKNSEMVKSLGADEVIDYNKEDFTQRSNTYDVIFDAVAKSSFSRAQKALKKDGIYLTTIPDLGIMLRSLCKRWSNKKAIFAASSFLWKQEDLVFVKELAEAGVLKSVIDTHYSFEEIVEAYHHVNGGHKRGSVVLTI